MIRSRSFCFIIWFCVHLTLVVARITTDERYMKVLYRPKELYDYPFANFRLENNNSECNTRVSDFCLIPECVRSASNFLQSMDFNVQPCDNFYKFSCGGPLYPKPRSKYDEEFNNNWDVISAIAQEKLRTMLEEESSPDEPRPFRLAKDFYKSCVNKAAINKKHGVRHLLEIVKKLGGWPVLEDNYWNESDFNWRDSLYKFPEHGFSGDQYIFSHEISVDQNKPKLIGNYYYGICETCEQLTDNATLAVHTYMVDIAVLLGADRNRACIQMMEVLEFEMTFRNIMKNHIIIFKGKPTEMTINELNATWPDVYPTLEYLNSFLPEEKKIKPNDVFTENYANFNNKFQSLINKTPKRVQANYIVWRAVEYSLENLQSDLEDIENIQSKVRNYITLEYEKIGWRECLGLVSKIMDISVNTMYLKKYFTEDTKIMLLKIFNDVKTEFIELLARAEWLDTEARGKAMRKADNITLNYIYRDELLHMQNLDKFYEELEITPNNYLGNILNLTMFRHHLNRHEYKIRNRLGDMMKWVQQWNGIPNRLKSFDIQAGYAYGDQDKVYKYNTFIITAGSLSGIIFNENRPRYMNYGAIGSLIGQGIANGFDNTRIHYDKENKTIHWKLRTISYFKRNTECLVEQYTNYAVNSMGINLMRQTGELNQNIADAGIKAAYYAYKAWVERNGPEQRLPGLSYTPEQIFWMSRANIWCDKYVSSNYVNGEFRVNGPLWNIDEFSRDFNCPIGSKMNPVKKCVIL